MFDTENVALPVWTNEPPAPVLLVSVTVPEFQALPGLDVDAVKAALEPCQASIPASRSPTSGAAARASRRRPGVDRGLNMVTSGDVSPHRLRHDVPIP
jgi:hypothetical protein